MGRTVNVYFTTARLFLLVNIAITIGLIKIANTSKIEWGIHTCVEKHCVSDLNNRIYLTLFFNKSKYQCHIFPFETDHWYTCDISDMYTVDCNETDLELNNDTYLLVSNEGDNGLHFDQIMFNIQDRDSNYSATIDSFYMSNIEFNELPESSFTQYQIGTNTYKAIPVAVTNILIDMEHIINNTANVSTFKNKAKVCIEEIKHKYIYENQQKNWSDAEQYCENNYGTHLAVILSEEDMMRVRLLTGPGVEAWIGLNDLKNEGNWEFSDGTLCNGHSCVNFTLWVSGEPNDYNGTSRTGEDCAHISHDVNGINDKMCFTPQRFICNWGKKKINDWNNYWIIGGIAIGIGLFIALCFTICGIVQVVKYRKLLKQSREKCKKVENENKKMKMVHVDPSSTTKVTSTVTTTYDHDVSSTKIQKMIDTDLSVLGQIQDNGQ